MALIILKCDSPTGKLLRLKLLTDDIVLFNLFINFLFV